LNFWNGKERKLDRDELDIAVVTTWPNIYLYFFAFLLFFLLLFWNLLNTFLHVNYELGRFQKEI